MNEALLKFIQTNSPDGGFLQSEYWKKFQEEVGRKVNVISTTNDDGGLMAYANIISHKLPVVGKYFYIPRGPVIEKSKIQNFFNDLIDLAKKNNISWVRIEPNSEEELNLIKDNLSENIKIKKSSVDMQPREILVMDISRSEDEILTGMKQKTRYNIKLAEKRGVKVYNSREGKYIEEFLKLMRVTSERDKIKSHPGNYYRRMFETIPPEILKLYIAEYRGKIIAANLVLFFGKIAAYMHGASDNEHRNTMAPYLLQWQQIVDAKKAGCERYDFGGVKIEKTDSSWSGITKFKTGFAPDTNPVQFPGCYDIVLNPFKYNLYRILQKIKRLI